MQVLTYSRAIKAPVEGQTAIVVLAENHHTNPSLKAGDAAYTSTVQEVKGDGVFITRNTRYEPA